jgi:DNA-binding GntR family transcriptional regulator
VGAGPAALRASLGRRPVPHKRQLTQTYGIAGGTVDKALAVLRGEGLVKTVTRRGIYVTAPEERP